MENKVWFIDTNVLTYWVLGSGLLKKICDTILLSDEFFIKYRENYPTSISFIDIITSAGLYDFKNDEFYVSYFTINELFSAIRDEVRSIMLFKEGTPISRWHDYRNTPEISEEFNRILFTQTLTTFDILRENKKIWFIPDGMPSEKMKNYLAIYAETLLNNKYMQMQDTTLLMTALYHGADYFVTADKRLIENISDIMFRKYQLNLILPDQASKILRNRL